MADEHYSNAVTALVEAMKRVGVVDPEDGCVAVFHLSSKRKSEYGPNCYWTPAKHVAELLVNQLGIEFFN